jgi:nicotinamidase-related amidase
MSYDLGSQATTSDVVTGTPDLLITKHVNSCFHGKPDLDRWLRERELLGLVVAGIATNHCCETTARVGATGF